MATNKKVLILGGGFGGIKMALELAKSDLFEISLLSDQDSFRYYPTLYHAATGGRLAASSIPLKEVLGDTKVKIIHDTAVSLDRNTKKVKTKTGKNYKYDELIIALGVVTNFFGIKGLEQYSYGIKSVDQAYRLRDHLHKLLMDEGKPDLNYVVIGGGPTGVELAGALPAYLRHIMDKHGVSKKSIHVDLVEAAPTLLPRLPKPFSKAVTKRLRQLGVKLYLGQTVQAETADALEVSGHSIKSHTVVWTAGVTNHPFLKANNFALSEHGKALVDDYLRTSDGIYVIGDNADTIYSGMAQTALYDAQFVAGNLLRQAAGKRPKFYRPKEPDTVIPVGPRWAAAKVHGVQVYGWVAWLLRSAADFIAYSDYEPWWKSSRHWMAENLEGDEECAICAGKAPSHSSATT